VARVVQSASAQALSSGDTSITVALSNPTADGNLLVANGVDGANNTTQVATPFSDSGAHVWATAVPLAAGTTVRFGQRYVKSITGQAVHTVTYTVPATSLFPSLAVAEITDIDPTAPLDQQNSRIAGSDELNPHATGTTPTTTDTDEIAIAGLSHNGSASPAFASAQGFTIETSQPNTAGMPVVLSSKPLGALVAQQEQYNLTPDNLVRVAAGIATYISGPGSVVPPEGHSRASPRF
jgi:hypothetical protein